MINSLAPDRCVSKFWKCNLWTHVLDLIREHSSHEIAIRWHRTPLTIIHHWLGNGLVPSSNKPLPEPMLTQLYVAIWDHLATMNWRHTWTSWFCLSTSSSIIILTVTHLVFHTWCNSRIKPLCTVQRTWYLNCHTPAILWKQNIREMQCMRVITGSTAPGDIIWHQRNWSSLI